jgi:hypothetical protein
MTPDWNLTRAIVLAIAGFAASPVGLLAQFGDTDPAELSAYTGVTFARLGAHPAFGASSGLSFWRYGIGLLDLSYMPLGGDALQSYPGRVSSSGLYDLNFSAHIRVPGRKRWEPYAIAGVAVLFSTYQLASLDSRGIVTYSGRSDTDLAFVTGAGLRYYVRKNWGVRTELRYTIGSRSFGRVLSGVFYQFEGEGSFQFRRRSASLLRTLYCSMNR